jgi:hypothetical protein
VRTKVQPVGKVHLVPSVKFEFIGSYRNSVRAVITKEGIFFSAPFLFRVFHAPFLLPWTCVRRLRKKAGFKQRGKRLIVEVEDEEGPIRLLLSKEMEEDFLKHYWPQKPKPIARRAFPRGSAQGLDQPEEDTEEETETVGTSASATATATAGVAEHANATANASPGAGIGIAAEVPTIPGAYPSVFTIVGMGMQAGGSSGAEAPPVPVGAPVYAKAPVAAPAPAVAPPPMPMPMPAPAPALAPEPTVSFYVPRTVSVKVPALATFTATIAAAATMIAEPRA